MKSAGSNRVFRYCSQSYKDYEIIVVDNNSTDNTLNKVKQYNITKVLKINDYLPGKALNIGIEKATGDYIVCLSAHCIPKNNKWLEHLVKAIQEDNCYAGVYGRQEPMFLAIRQRFNVSFWLG